MGAATASLALLLSVMATQPSKDVASDSVDLVEVNHFHDDQGRLVFDQVIFYDWSPAQSRYLVRAWRLLKTQAQLPQQDPNNEGYVTVWHDGDVLRNVHARVMRETWTQHDPELLAREYLPKEMRRELYSARQVQNNVAREGAR